MHAMAIIYSTRAFPSYDQRWQWRDLFLNDIRCRDIRGRFHWDWRRWGRSINSVEIHLFQDLKTAERASQWRDSIIIIVLLLIKLTTKVKTLQISWTIQKNKQYTQTKKNNPTLFFNPSTCTSSGSESGQNSEKKEDKPRATTQPNKRGDAGRARSPDQKKRLPVRALKRVKKSETETFR